MQNIWKIFFYEVNGALLLISTIRHGCFLDDGAIAKICPLCVCVCADSHTHEGVSGRKLATDL